MHMTTPSDKRSCDFCLNRKEYDFLFIAPHGAICSSCVSECVATLASSASEILEKINLLEGVNTEEGAEK